VNVDGGYTCVGWYCSAETVFVASNGFVIELVAPRYTVKFVTPGLLRFADVVHVSGDRFAG
jgi:hypothetical protein